MIEPLDRSRRDSTLFQFTTRQLRDFIDPNHVKGGAKLCRKGRVKVCRLGGA